MVDFGDTVSEFWSSRGSCSNLRLSSLELRVTNSEGGLGKRGSRHDALESGKFHRRQAGSG